MLDLVRLYLKAGDGGNGRVAFYRNRHVLKGGPVGGDGGDGGDIIIRVDPNLNTLQHFSGKKKFIAADGERGGKARQMGKRGESIELLVPSGTLVWLYQENHISAWRRSQHGVQTLVRRDECEWEKYWVEKETHPAPVRERDDIDADERPRFADFLHARREDDEAEYAPLENGQLTKLVLLDEKRPEVVICQGGFGGRGNDTFKSASNTTPMEAEYGTWGEQKIIFLELKLLANIGLVGLPNAGKSTLISVLTKAKPKIADYPFTTLQPHLGVLDYGDGRSLVLADIPGLIDGASEGRGLGFEFLRHLDNCKALVVMLSLENEKVFDKTLSTMQKAKLLRVQLQTLMNELGDYSEQLASKKILLVINKIDLYASELIAAIKNEFESESENLVLISAATGVGIAELKEKFWRAFADDGV